MAIGIQNQYFGTEIEMTGITRQRAAEAVAELFGTRAVYDGGYYQTWSVMDREGKKWKFMYDGSIYTQRRERGQMIQNQIMTMIRQEDIRDDNGEFLKFGTHIFRHCYGKKLTEMHVDDWMIAKLLGHTSIYSVHHYRKIGNKLMADETRAAREKMDMILLDIIEGWDDYEI